VRVAPRRILIDGSMARGGGGFTYLVNVVPRLAAAAPDDRFLLWVRTDRLRDSIPQAPNLRVERLPDLDWTGRLRFTYLDAARVAARFGADLYFSAGESAPLATACPTIASFRNPNVFTSVEGGWPWRQRLRLRVLRGVAQLSAWSCDRILFVSEDSAGWIGDALGLPSSRRAVIHHGIDREAWAARPARPLHPWPYILSVSSIYRYKNFVRLIEAYAELARWRTNLPDLVILGDDADPEYAQRMQQARRATGTLAEQIHILGEVPYAEVQAWYAGAELFAFPSYLETFGHPLLEAMAAGVPLVAADIAVSREVAGDAAFYADPRDPRSLARAMDSALFAPHAREILVKRGRERVREFGWDRSAQRLLALFDDVLAERARRSFPARTPKLGLPRAILPARCGDAGS
jgi:glycosyltransferase involved in cell wall biosynthesis